MGLITWLQSIMALVVTGIGAVAGLVRGLIGLVFPVFAKTGDFQRLGRGLKAFLQLVMLFGLLVGLWWLNRRLGLEEVLRAPRPELRAYWLPLLFLAVYLLGWTAWGIAKLLRSPIDAAEHPDLDDAWFESLRALEQEGIDLKKVPLYLVLGRASGGDRAIFHDANLDLVVKQAPRRLDEPMYMYATRTAAFLTCGGASVLGAAAEQVQAMLAQGTAGGRLEARALFASLEDDLVRAEDFQPHDESASSSGVDITAGGDLGESSIEIRAVRASAVMRAAQAVALPTAPARAAPRRALVTTEEAEALTARLAHLCRRARDAREPFCPINGLVILLPFAASDTEAAAKQFGALVRQDLNVLREVLQVNCPVYVLVCDLEQASGFPEFLARFGEAQKRKVLGRSFPLAPDLDNSGRVRMIESGLRWFALELVPALTTKVWRVERPEVVMPDRNQSVTENSRVFQLVWELSQRHSRFARVLVRALGIEDRDPWRLGGCYFAATGRDAMRGQGFVAGVFERLDETQDDVAWTREAREQDRRATRLAGLGYVGVVVLIVAFVLTALASRAL